MCSRPSCRRVAVDRNSILPLHAPYLSFPVIAFAPSQTLPPVPDLAFPFPPPSSPITSLPLPRLSGRYTVPERDGCAFPSLQLITPSFPLRSPNTQQHLRFPDIRHPPTVNLNSPLLITATYRPPPPARPARFGRFPPHVAHMRSQTPEM